MLLETNLGSNGPSATMLFVIIQLPEFMWFCLRKYGSGHVSLSPLKWVNNSLGPLPAKESQPSCNVYIFFSQSLSEAPWQWFLWNLIPVCWNQITIMWVITDSRCVSLKEVGKKKSMFFVWTLAREALPHFFQPDWLSAALNPLRGSKHWSAKLWKLSARGLPGIFGSVRWHYSPINASNRSLRSQNPPCLDEEVLHSHVLHIQ